MWESSIMIKYKDIMGQLAKLGYTSSYIRSHKLLGESAMSALRNDQHVNSQTLNTVCLLLHCQPNDIMEVIYEPEVNAACRQKYKALEDAAQTEDTASDPDGRMELDQ